MTKISKYLQMLHDKYDINAERVIEAIRYLRHYGYLLSEEADLKDIIFAVRSFQDMFGLTNDGELGIITERAMSYPRCGCPDMMREETHGLRKWASKNVKVYIQTPWSGFSRADFSSLLNRAHDNVEKICGINITLVQSSSNADILVGTGSGRRDQFDGPGGTLAWAYLPQPNHEKNRHGQIQVKGDSAETWVDNPRSRGIQTINVYTHELLHALGLGHSNIKGALMAPTYNPSIAIPQGNDDIPRLQARYGKSVKEEPVDPEDPTDPDDSEVTITIKGDIKRISIPGFRVSKQG